VKGNFKNTCTRQARAVSYVLWNMGCDICMEFPIVVFDFERGEERTFYADIWFHEVNVDIEIDGWQHTSDPIQLQQDADRHRLLSEFDIPVLRFTNNEVDANPVKAAHTIYKLLHQKPNSSEKERLFLEQEWERRHANPWLGPVL
jgi:very-short-patch-repair endonuclease